MTPSMLYHLCRVNKYKSRFVIVGKNVAWNALKIVFEFPYCLAIVPPSMYTSCKGEGGGDKGMFLFSGKEAYLGFYIGGSAPCSKNIGNGPIKWLLLGEKKKKTLSIET
jgi:hypothetical protein